MSAWRSRAGIASRSITAPSGKITLSPPAGTAFTLRLLGRAVGAGRFCEACEIDTFRRQLDRLFAPLLLFFLEAALEFDEPQEVRVGAVFDRRVARIHRRARRFHRQIV